MSVIETQDFYFAAPDYTAIAHIEKNNGIFSIKADTVRNKTLQAVGSEHESIESALEELIRMILNNYKQVIKMSCSETFIAMGQIEEILARLQLTFEIEKG